MTTKILKQQGDGSYRSLLPVELKKLAAFCAREVRELLKSNSDLCTGLTPAVHPGDERAQREFEELIGSELADSRISDLETLASLADAKELSAEEVETCIRALTAIRLIYGELLGIHREEEDADANKASYEKEYGLEPLALEKSAFSKPVQFYEKVFEALTVIQEQLVLEYSETLS